MDLHTVTSVSTVAGAGGWRPGDAWLAGGTFLFSQPQPHLRRLIDLSAEGWEPSTVTPDGWRIAATCTIAELARFVAPPQWTACHPLVRQCCEAFLASFKIWNMATVGGNLCTALPAGPMTSLTAALDGTCLLLAGDGTRRTLPVADFVTGDGATALAPGELLRAVTLPVSALRCRTAFRQGSLSTLGRSAALLIGRHDPQEDSFVLTVTASTVRPLRLRFAGIPTADTLGQAVADGIPTDAYVDDVHGLPAWRRHLTRTFAEEIRAELAGAGTP